MNPEWDQEGEDLRLEGDLEDMRYMALNMMGTVEGYFKKHKNFHNSEILQKLHCMIGELESQIQSVKITLRREEMEWQKQP